MQPPSSRDAPADPDLEMHACRLGLLMRWVLHLGSRYRLFVSPIRRLMLGMGAGGSFHE